MNVELYCRAVEDGGRGSGLDVEDVAGQNTDGEALLADLQSSASGLAFEDDGGWCSMSRETFGCFAVVTKGRQRRTRGKKRKRSHQEDLICDRSEYQACIFSCKTNGIT